MPKPHKIRLLEQGHNASPEVVRMHGDTNMVRLAGMSKDDLLKILDIVFRDYVTPDQDPVSLGHVSKYYKFQREHVNQLHEQHVHLLNHNTP